MPRSARIVIPDEPAVYHVMSRTALAGYPLEDVEKDFLVDLIRRLSRIYFAEVFGFSIMGNHFHLLVRLFPEKEVSDEEVKKRYALMYGKDKICLEGQVPFLKQKWTSLSEFCKELKQAFSRFYNKRHQRQGFFWGERFKSLIVEKGETLINCLTYIDLNPVRAGLEGGKRKGIAEKTVERERKKGYRITRTDRFRYRTRYFSDSGIIGSKEFVRQQYARVKELLGVEKEKTPKPISGLKGLYSLKRLTE